MVTAWSRQGEVPMHPCPTVRGVSGPEDEQVSHVLEAVGRVASNDTMLEHFLANVFEALMRSDMAAVLARGQSFDALAGSINAMLGELEPSPLRTAVADAIKTARDLHRERNLVVHSLWFGIAGYEDRMEAMRYRRWKIEPDMRTWTVTDLRELADRILDHAWRVHSLFMDLTADVRERAAMLAEMQAPDE
jgi:hypothetical protein